MIASFFVYTLVLVSLIDTAPAPTVIHVLTWLLGLVLELVLLGASLALYGGPHQQPTAAGAPAGGAASARMTDWEGGEIAVDMVRILLLAGLVLGYAGAALARRRAAWRKHGARGSAEERASLLGHAEGGHGASLLGHAEGGHGANGALPNGHAYGSVPAERGGGGGHGEPPKEAWSRPDKVPSKSWWEYVRGYSLFFPYLWPSKSVRLQATVLLCFGLVLVARVVNVLVPYQVGVITNALADDDEATPGGRRIPWAGICLYLLYRLLQGNNGLLGAARATLWVPISQYSYQALSTAAFEHVHGLSLDFHLGKKTGEVLSALSKGNSINTFLEQVTFQVVPMLIDLAIAVGYFLVQFDAYYALVIAIVTFAYLYLTIRLAQWRADIRREMVNFSRQEDAVKNDSMVSYETVKYFNAEGYEFDRYRGAVRDFQRAEYKVLISLNIMNVSQNLVFTLGLLVTCFIAAYQVTTGQKRVGDFTALITYMAQLQGPLNFFGTFYRSIQFAMINSERMLELFKEQPTVVDDPAARALPTCEGAIRWNDVGFSYDQRRPALNGVSFTCAPGTTTALVGESGGGKSTIFRLLFRFYNVERGGIQIDGHDVRDVTLDSLRRHIGVVPQDTVLFNESLMYNLRYARPEATDEQVFQACRAASIHDKILAFPDGYQSRVGERGLKLSGGEKQRVAIARTILKDPRIILLDEATAALDTETEQHIQTALHRLAQGRTTLVIAHRLSTITTADQILVLSQGRVVERGTHPQLLAQAGRYASMWRRQVKAQRAADQAKALTDRAELLRERAQSVGEPGDEAGSSGETSAGSGGGSGSGSSSSDDEEKRGPHATGAANGTPPEPNGTPPGSAIATAAGAAEGRRSRRESAASKASQWPVRE